MTSTVCKAKAELARHKASRRCCQIAELSALLHMDGTYQIRGENNHYLITESTGVHTARKIYTLTHMLFRVNTSLVKVQRRSPRRQNVYLIEIANQPGFYQMLNELGILDSSLSPEAAIPRRIIRNDCCVAAALRGAFQGGGYVAEPYGPADFEITCSSREAAVAFGALFARKMLKPKMRKRRNHWVLYLKQRRQISDFLAIVGAHSAYLEWESQTIMNSTKNTVNRLVNCDSANARRLAEASLRQCEAIEKLDGLGILKGTESKLTKLAEARMSNPQASLAELGRIMEPPISKAIVQSRMRRLLSMLPSNMPSK